VLEARHLSPLAAFRVRSFRFQWPADLLASCAFEMETLILGWYVMTETGSVVLLTVFGSLQFLGTLASPMFGVLGDRLGGRTMLCAIRGISGVLAALVMALAASGLLAPAWVLVIAALAGIVRPNDLVMRNTLIGETIPPADLMGAIGMSRASTDSARVGGALAGAGLSAILGVAPAYVVVTSLYAVSLALTLGIARSRPVPDPSAPAAPTVGASGTRRGDLIDGLRYVATTPRLLAAMWLAFLINLTAYPACGGLLPYVARHVYAVGATGLGWLAASFSLGGLLGSLTMVVIRGTRHPERAMLVYTAIWYALLLAFGQVRGLSLGVTTLLVAGYVQNIALISMTASLLDAAGDRFRARVMGVRQLAVYGLPVGLIASGALIERIGFPLTLTLTSTVGLLFTLLIGVRWRASMWHTALSSRLASGG
jgi:hypothetical protein